MASLDGETEPRIAGTTGLGALYARTGHLPEDVSSAFALQGQLDVLMQPRLFEVAGQGDEAEGGLAVTRCQMAEVPTSGYMKMMKEPTEKKKRDKKLPLPLAG
ncbi:hypothetical protein MKX08_008997 [Trichoderma sp. CBMAI-0020]|nr:hypothetical protein MKX08_008997 [Trichoderma sp. CBMAI-0020]